MGGSGEPREHAAVVRVEGVSGAGPWPNIVTVASKRIGGSPPPCAGAARCRASAANRSPRSRASTVRRSRRQGVKLSSKPETYMPLGSRESLNVIQAVESTLATPETVVRRRCVSRAVARSRHQGYDIPLQTGRRHSISTDEPKLVAHHHTQRTRPPIFERECGVETVAPRITFAQAPTPNPTASDLPEGVRRPLAAPLGCGQCLCRARAPPRRPVTCSRGSSAPGQESLVAARSRADLAA